MRVAISMSILAMMCVAVAGCQSGGGNAAPASTAPTGAVAGGVPPDIADLVNTPAASATGQMQSRGYSMVQELGSQKYWWNPRTTVCATTVTSNGRFQQIAFARMRYCGQQ